MQQQHMVWADVIWVQSKKGWKAVKSPVKSFALNF